MAPTVAWSAAIEGPGFDVDTAFSLCGGGRRGDVLGAVSGGQPWLCRERVANVSAQHRELSLNGATQGSAGPRLSPTEPGSNSLSTLVARHAADRLVRHRQRPAPRCRRHLRASSATPADRVALARPLHPSAKPSPARCSASVVADPRLRGGVSHQDASAALAARSAAS
jgi:hypothetical protein